MTLRTSFIVGFPGETEKEFEELRSFVQEAPFDWMGAFGYSDQEGAAAFAEGEKLSAREIESRRKYADVDPAENQQKKKKALVGQEFDLLLEGTSEETDLLWKAAPRCMPPKSTVKSS